MRENNAKVGAGMKAVNDTAEAETKAPDTNSATALLDPPHNTAVRTYTYTTEQAAVKKVTFYTGTPDSKKDLLSSSRMSSITRKQSQEDAGDDEDDEKDSDENSGLLGQLFSCKPYRVCLRSLPEAAEIAFAPDKWRKLWNDKWASITKDSSWTDVDGDKEGLHGGQLAKIRTDFFHLLLRLWAHEDVASELYELYDKDGDEFMFYIPQLTTFLVHGGYEKAHQLESFLLDKCSISLHFAHRLYWFLLSFQDGGKGYASESLSATFSHQQEEGALLLHAVEAFGGISAALMDKGMAPGEDRKAFFLTDAEVALSPISYSSVPFTSAPLRSSTPSSSDMSLPIPVLQTERFLEEEEDIESARVTAMAEAHAHVGSQEHLHLFQQTPRFLKALVELADKLIPLPLADRRATLRLGLEAIAASFLPGNALYIPVGDPYHRVFRIHCDESFPFSTKERVPYLLCLEVVDYHPERIRRREKQAKQTENKKLFRLRLPFNHQLTVEWGDKDNSSSAESSSLSAEEKSVFTETEKEGDETELESRQAIGQRQKEFALRSTQKHSGNTLRTDQGMQPTPLFGSFMNTPSIYEKKTVGKSEDDNMGSSNEMSKVQSETLVALKGETETETEREGEESEKGRASGNLRRKSIRKTVRLRSMRKSLSLSLSSTIEQPPHLDISKHSRLPLHSAQSATPLPETVASYQSDKSPFRRSLSDASPQVIGRYRGKEEFPSPVAGFQTEEEAEATLGQWAFSKRSPLRSMSHGEGENSDSARSLSRIPTPRTYEKATSSELDERSFGTNLKYRTPFQSVPSNVASVRNSKQHIKETRASSSEEESKEMEEHKSKTTTTPPKRRRKKRPRGVSSSPSKDQAGGCEETGKIKQKEGERESEEKPQEASTEQTAEQIPSSSSSSPPQVIFKERWSEKEKRIRQASPYGHLSGWRLLPIIVKSNDDLRQEQIAAQLIAQFKKIFEDAGVPVYLRAYDVLAINKTCGLIEGIYDSISLDALKKNHRGYTNLKDFWITFFGPEGSKGYKRALSHFVASLAGYSIVSYLLQIKDRHNGNLMLDKSGNLIHIDFGFLLSNSPGKNINFERAPFKLTEEFVELLGGARSAIFRSFRRLCVRAYLAARREMHKIIVLLEMMVIGNEDLPCFRAGPDLTIAMLKQRFNPELKTGACVDFVHSLVNKSIDSWSTRWYDKYQRCCTGIY